MKFIFPIYLLGVLTFNGVAGCTPSQKQLQLLEASKKADTATVRSLLAHGADVNAKDNDGGSALILAAARGDIATVQTLLEHGADVNAKANDGGSALMVAEKRGRVEIIRLLKRAGAK